MKRKNLLGTPETSRNGRRTRKARRAFTSNPSFISVDSAVLTLLNSVAQLQKLHNNRRTEYANFSPNKLTQ